jgi:perosamine synthetase
MAKRTNNSKKIIYMKVPLTIPYFTEEENIAILNVLKSGWIMQGPKVAEFEKKIANYVGVRNAVAVSSGTTALHLALIALGIKKGDEIIVPSLSFIASANCILYVGAKPVFVDVDSKTYNLDPKDIEKKISKKTKAIMVVHQVGLSADMDPIMKIAKKNKLFVIEDAACSLGATYKEKQTGGFGNIACFSFHPRKSITTAEGGILTTNNDKIAESLKNLRNHGLVRKNGIDTYPFLGYNYRMSDISAALGLAQFKKINPILKRKRELATKYNKAFSETENIIPPHTPSYSEHTYQSYVVRVKGGRGNRDRIMNDLEKKGIACRAGIMAIHREPLYVKMFGKISLPETESANDEGIILPLYMQMTNDEQRFVITSLKELAL